MIKSIIQTQQRILGKSLTGIKGLNEITFGGLPKEEHIIAAPTLIKKLPLTLRRIIGDLSNVDCVLVKLDLRKVKINETTSLI